MKTLIDISIKLIEIIVYFCLISLIVAFFSKTSNADSFYNNEFEQENRQRQEYLYEQQQLTNQQSYQYQQNLRYQQQQYDQQSRPYPVQPVQQIYPVFGGYR